MWNIHTVEYFGNTKKESTDTCYSMDETLKLHAKWKKPVTEDHIFYDSIYMKCPEQARSTETENRLVVAQDWEVGGKWGVTTHGMSFFLEVMKMF